MVVVFSNLGVAFAALAVLTALSLASSAVLTAFLPDLEAVLAVRAVVLVVLAALVVSPRGALEPGEGARRTPPHAPAPSQLPWGTGPAVAGGRNPRDADDPRVALPGRPRVAGGSRGAGGGFVDLELVPVVKAAVLVMSAVPVVSFRVAVWLRGLRPRESATAFAEQCNCLTISKHAGPT